ncbi:MAG: class I SAM-dependent methyltransferase [Erysipelotrichaceae bacterium]|nr:class I SAM-dependent methyltransferase [Erysipelotrichaceae bacterium]
MKTKTIEYYNENVSKFVNDTQDVVFCATQDMFLSYLNEGDSILDFGCGSGRDTKYFLSKGYKVDATDGSEEICKVASDYTGINVKCLLFNELDEIDKYDGIWACASILHLDKDDLIDVFHRIARALKDNGILYTSFKYSEFEGMRNGRYFTDFTIESFNEFQTNIPEFVIEKKCITSDVRVGREDEKWLNLIMRKK